mgnify:CR=1 FL=1
MYTTDSSSASASGHIVAVIEKSMTNAQAEALLTMLTHDAQGTRIGNSVTIWQSNIYTLHLPKDIESRIPYVGLDASPTGAAPNFLSPTAIFEFVWNCLVSIGTSLYNLGANLLQAGIDLLCGLADAALTILRQAADVLRDNKTLIDRGPDGAGISGQRPNRGKQMAADKVKVASPATLSNLGSGFDVFGLALSEPNDVIEARRIEERTIIVEKIEGWGATSITKDPARNSAGAAARAVLDRAGAEFCVALSIKKGIRPCSGIGSSGASAAGGAYAANLLLDDPLALEEVVHCAASAEQITSGSFHADNVGPAVLGGFTIVKSYEPFRILRMDPPASLGVVVTMPDFLVNTKEARKVLPRQVDLKSMIFEVGNAASLVLGVCRGDVDLIGRSMMDIVVEPARAPLNPHLREAQSAALNAGAAGTFLGGSGPCVIAVFDKAKGSGREIEAAVRSVYESHGVKCDSWVTAAGPGCRRL